MGVSGNGFRTLIRGAASYLKDFGLRQRSGKKKGYLSGKPGQLDHTCYRLPA